MGFKTGVSLSCKFKQPPDSHVFIPKIFETLYRKVYQEPKCNNKVAGDFMFV